MARARAVFEQLRKEFQERTEAGAIGEPIMMIGPARPVDRDELAERLQPIRTGAERMLERPLIVVATQCIEAGVDIDLDALITEIAPLDCLRQRFGRLNRAGRDVVPYAAIVSAKSDISGRANDPVYGEAIKPAWDCLTEAATSESGDEIVDFGVSQFSIRMNPEALSPKDDAPILLPAHLDLLSETSPVPAADPDVALYLHGVSRQPDSLTVIWRADINSGWVDQDVTRLLTLVPPRSLEAIELPIWAVRRWLEGSRKSPAEMADVPTREPEQGQEGWQRRARFPLDRKQRTLPMDRPGSASPGRYGYRPSTLRRRGSVWLESELRGARDGRRTKSG